MATVVTASTTTVGNNITLASNEDLFLAPGVTRSSTTAAGISALFTGHAIDVLGTVYGDPFGVRLGANATGSTFSTLVIGTGASVVSTT